MHALHHPLSGLRVLELSQVMAGPVSGLMLADLGAQVYKIEKFPGGDDSRAFNSNGASDVPASFQVLNRGKKSIALDLKHPAGVAALKRMVAQSDVLTENFRPGVMERLGLGPDELLAINPKLIYCSITGYGRKGPLAQRGGFDLILQAFSGLISVTGEAGRAPVKPGVSIADVNGGILAAFAVVAAYVEVLRTGRGQRVETSLLQASMQQLYWYAALFFSTGRTPDRLGTAHPIIAPYQTFHCSDGELALGSANETNWVRSCNVLGHPEWITDRRFLSAKLRLENRPALETCINAVLINGTRAEWEQRFTKAGVPAGPVQSVAEALNHPQSRIMDIVIEADAAGGGKLDMIGLPMHFDGQNAPARSAAPRLGEHTLELLREFNFAEEEIGALFENVAIYADGTAAPASAMA